MAKMVEVKLHTLTCLFAGGDEGKDLEVTGILKALTFDHPDIIKATKVIFDFPNGPIRIRKDETVTIDRDARVVMSTPSTDDPTFGGYYVKFGGELFEKDERPDTDDSLGQQWRTRDTTEVINTTPFMHRLFFGEHDQIVRADISIVFVHPL